MALSTINSVEHAGKHEIVCTHPAPGFFEGALLGNGALGAVVCTRPDAVQILFGHNNVWDIRLAENHRDEIGAFEEVLARVKGISPDLQTLDEDPWYREYTRMAQENYRKPYPRPYPCGSLVLGFDRRQAQMLGHRLDIASGICEVYLRVAGATITVRIFVEPAADRLWVCTVDAAGQAVAAPFNRIRLLPDPDTPTEFPPPHPLTSDSDGCLAFRQTLPYQEPDQYDLAAGHPQDHAFRLGVCTNQSLERRTRHNTVSGAPEEMGDLERGLVTQSAFLACVQLDEGLSAVLPVGVEGLALAGDEAYESALIAVRQAWEAYWSRAGVTLDDEVLERTWYRNLYFLNCAVAEGVTCPGLFANWSYRQIGTAWHGDYHMNYNTQQPFWVTFSSNQVEKHLPYVDMIDRLRPVSRKWAGEYYGLRGAFYPHSAFPVEMTMSPYPVPTWGWEVCETPWAVQSLWWHYLYTQDRAFLVERAFEPIREAVEFLTAYMLRPEAHGNEWGDENHHVYPTVVPELYGLTPGLRLNKDCIADLTLIRFVFNAYLLACRILDKEVDERATIDAVTEILAHFPECPTADSERGRVWVSVEGENPEIVYNVPVSTMPVFPGEEVGIGSPEEQYAVACNTYRNQQNEGGNDLVLLNMQGARLGMLDLEAFSRQIRYCEMSNGTCTDLAMQAHGRYRDTTPFDFMAHMGIWFENFALPAVINECLLQSYAGTLRLFPNWPLERPAEFRTLRAVGAFLVSAACAGGDVLWVTVTSEVGATLRILSPWPNGALCRRDGVEQELTGSVLTIETNAGETLELLPRPV